MPRLPLLLILLAALGARATRKALIHLDSSAARNVDKEESEESRPGGFLDACGLHVKGSVERNHFDGYPHCKCESFWDKVYCGDKKFERKWDGDEVKRECGTFTPYCARRALDDLSTTQPVDVPVGGLPSKGIVDYNELRDVSGLFSEGHLFKYSDKEYKCCASDANAEYKVQDISQPNWMLPRENWMGCWRKRSACGCMFGRAWHNYHKNEEHPTMTGKCMMSLSELSAITGAFPDDLDHMIDSHAQAAAVVSDAINNVLAGA